MPAKHCTSKKYKKPGVFVDHSSVTNQSNSAFLQSLRAKKYQQIRNGGKNQSTAASQQSKSNAKQQENGEDDGEEEADDDNDEAEASPSELVTPEGLSISLTPFNPTFTASHSACATSTAESSLSDDKVLGAALYEWLLPKESWDCHALWERFLLEWEPVTETERPPGTNRPLNLHGYITGFRNTNNKHSARSQVKTVRDTLKMERAIAMRDAPEDPFSRLNQQALNGSLLMYYLKTKGLMPYESENQKKKKLAQELKRKRDEAGDEEAEGESKEAVDDEAEEEQDKEAQSKSAKQQPSKKSKVSHAANAASAPSKQNSSQSFKANSSNGASSSTTSTSSSLKLGQANAFAALLDCD